MKEAADTGGAVNVFRMDNDQYLSIRIKDIHFLGQECTLIFLQDITILQQLRERETQDRLTTMYSANVSHEMRTPLSTCINFTDLLLTQEKDKIKRKHLEIIKFSSVMMLNNVNDTLDNAQIQRGTFQPKPVQCEIRSTINDVVRVIEMQAASKNITISIDIPKKVIVTDKQRV